MVYHQRLLNVGILPVLLARHATQWKKSRRYVTVEKSLEALLMRQQQQVQLFHCVWLLAGMLPHDELKGLYMWKTFCPIISSRGRILIPFSRLSELHPGKRPLSKNFCIVVMATEINCASILFAITHIFSKIHSPHSLSRCHLKACNILYAMMKPFYSLELLFSNQKYRTYQMHLFKRHASLFLAYFSNKYRFFCKFLFIIA